MTLSDHWSVLLETGSDTPNAAHRAAPGHAFVPQSRKLVPVHTTSHSIYADPFVHPSRVPVEILQPFSITSAHACEHQKGQREKNLRLTAPKSLSGK